MLYILVFRMFDQTLCILVCWRYCAVHKLPKYDESDMRYMRRNVGHKECTRTNTTIRLSLRGNFAELDILTKLIFLWMQLSIPGCVYYANKNPLTY